MQIQKIRIENFKSIYEPLEIDFQEVKGFWKISGEVGSGKTSIGEAIIYGLFGSIWGKNLGDLISWNRKKGQVEVWCRSKGKSIYIKREMKSSGQSPIYVEIDGEELVFTNKRDAQIQLENEYYDTSRVTIELLCIISFNNFKSLATLNTSDTKKFLDQVLGFYTLTEWADACKGLRSENSGKIKEAQYEIKKLESQISKLEEISNTDVIHGDIEATKELIHKLTEDIKRKRSDIEDLTTAYTLQKTKLIKDQSSTLSLGKSKKTEIEFIEKGTCPTCGAPIDQSQLESKRKERDILLEHYNELSKKIKDLDSKHIEDTRVIRDEIKIIESELEQHKKLLHQLEEQAKRLSINLGEIESIKREAEEKMVELSGYQSEDTEWQALYDVLSTQARSKILGSFIPSLNSNIYKYATRLHLPYNIEFDSSFKCNISLSGIDKEIPISSLSTGQLKTVDMVIILGVLGTIIGSNGINVLFLDELFSNLDTERRNEMCGVLKETIGDDTTIFIISHMDMENKHFDGTLALKLENRDGFEKHTVVNIKTNFQKL